MPGVLMISERALPSRGGLAVATSRIARQAAQRGEIVHLLCLSRDAAPGMRGRREESGVITHPLGPPHTEERRLMALADHARELVATYDLDLVHGMYATRGGYVATLVGALHGIASVVSIRGNDLDRGLYRHEELPLLTHALREATVATAVSRVAAEAASAVFRREVVHVTNSVDALRFYPERRDNTLAAALGLGEGPVLGFFGELREKKGMRFLLPAFAMLARERPAHLLLVGGLRDDARDAYAEFERVAPEAAARVRLVEHGRDVERLRRLYGLCDLLVFPSLFEGTPNAMLEAMACERLVLGTAVGGHLELIEHGESGALLPLDALDRLPEAIAEMLDLPPERRAAMGAAARARVLAHHDEALESAAYGEIYARARSSAS
ncbi:MAG: glycosyltransferase [Myxococcales bacterium]|nr:glycosyltransferase [Myxococcales bacterium]